MNRRALKRNGAAAAAAPPAKGRYMVNISWRLPREASTDYIGMGAENFRMKYAEFQLVGNSLFLHMMRIIWVATRVSSGSSTPAEIQRSMASLGSANPRT